jgi:hypothetical protein
VSVNYFKGSDDNFGPRIVDQVHLDSLLPRIVTWEDSLLLERLCSKEELWKVLKYFAKDKILGPDGWTIEFFLHFFEFVGEALLKVVEDSRRRGEVINALNSSFIVLIQKFNKPTNFGDYRPITLCNLCYKIIAKILANKINLFSLDPCRENNWVFGRGDRYSMP